MLQMQRTEAELTPEYERYCIEQAEAWLSKVRKAAQCAKRLEEQAEAQYAAADNLKGIDYSEVRVQTSPTPDAIPNAVARIIEVGSKLAEISESAKRYVREAADTIAAIDDVSEAACLRLYYVDALPAWGDVQARLGIKSYDGLMRLRRRALVHVYDAMPYRERDAMPPAY